MRILNLEYGMKIKSFKPIYRAYKGNLLDLSICLDGGIIRRTLNISRTQ
jgi:hypothetical protein